MCFFLKMEKNGVITSRNQKNCFKGVNVSLNKVMSINIFNFFLKKTSSSTGGQRKSFCKSMESDLFEMISLESGWKLLTEAQSKCNHTSLCFYAYKDTSAIPIKVDCFVGNKQKHPLLITNLLSDSWRNHNHLSLGCQI